MRISSLDLFSKSDQIAFIGSGGKTSLIFSIAKELFPEKCVITTTTKMAMSEVAMADHSIQLDHIDNLDLDKLKKISIIYQRDFAEGPVKIIGLPAKPLREFSRKLKKEGIPLLIEADGSKRKPLKFPGDNEPNIPEFVNKVCVVVGLSALGKPFSSEIVHRFEYFSNYLKINAGEVISPEHLFNYLVLPNGGLKSIPPRAEKILFLHQSDCLVDFDQINEIALKLQSQYDQVILSRIENGELIIDAHWGKIGCVILAAGEGRRFGGPKQLALFNQKTFIENVIENAQKMNFVDIVLVLGAYYKEILAVVSKDNIHITENKNWRKGQSTSVKAGIEFFGKNKPEAILFLLVDQPQINEDLIKNTLNKYAYTKADIIVHEFNGKNRHPTLFSKNTFKKLIQIKGEEGGRQIFKDFNLLKIKINDPYMAQDIDTKEELNNFLEVHK